MTIISIRTDRQEAELGLFNGETQIAYETWQAHKQLAESLHKKIAELLENQKLELPNIEGVVCFKGPGSFTGLRIGLSVANSLAYSLKIPIVGIEGEDQWLQKGLKAVLKGKNDKLVMPAYGAPVHITKPKS